MSAQSWKPANDGTRWTQDQRKVLVAEMEKGGADWAERAGVQLERTEIACLGEARRMRQDEVIDDKYDEAMRLAHPHAYGERRKRWPSEAQWNVVALPPKPPPKTTFKYPWMERFMRAFGWVSDGDT